MIRIEEYWDPVLKGLDQIVVTRRIPAIHIYLSLDPIDVNTPGYQTTNVPTKFWPMPPTKHNHDDDDYARRNKRTNNRGGGGGGNSSRGGRNAKFQRNQTREKSSN